MFISKKSYEKISEKMIENYEALWIMKKNGRSVNWF
jgi:hypothetical protein